MMKNNSIIETAIAVRVDRTLGKCHSKHKYIHYLIYYGYIEGVMALDGEEPYAYILGVNGLVDKFTGKIIDIVWRKDDKEDK